MNKKTLTECLYVYILLCENGAYYTGYTTHLERRFKQHVQGSAKCKFTQSFKPVKIAQYWKIYGDKGTAMKIEKYIKTLNKAEKEHIILYPHTLEEIFLNK